MNAMQSLLTLLAHAERERDAALAALRGCQIEQRNAQAQADQLQRYRRDYEQRWNRSFADGGGGIAIVQCYQGFMERLGAAIDAQQRVVAMSAQRLANAQLHWQQLEIRVASVRKLIDRRDTEARSEEARREQKQLDEHAMRSAWQRAAAAGLSPL